MQVCPSILEYKDEDYFNTINKLSPYYKYFQIDFADGIYVDNKTAQFEEFVKLIPNYSKQFSSLTFDFHFMVKYYESYLRKLQTIKEFIKIKNVFIHYNLLPKIDILETKYQFPIGLVINPQDQVDDLVKQYSLNSISCLQIMSIEPGAQCKPFIPETLKKIEQLRVLGYRNKIFLDGAVNDKTIPIITSLKYKPDFICPGSFLAKTPTLKVNVDYLTKMI